VVSPTSDENIQVIGFPIDKGGNPISKLYVYYRPSQSIAGRFLGVIESYTSSNGRSINDQISEKRMTGRFTYQTISAELIKEITVVENVITKDVDGNPLTNELPFNWEKWGKCIKDKFLSQGPVEAALCIAAWDICLAAFATDCLISQLNSKE
jgi:hypothetical protein